LRDRFLSIVQAILQQYDIPENREVEYLGGAGGFSGAQIWKIGTSQRTYCLRRWPPSHPDRTRLDWINLVLSHALNQDCPFVAAPIESVTGQPYVSVSGFFWELSPWMPGEASFENDPNDVRLENAMTCLARFHLASAQVNLGFLKSENATTRFSALKNAPQLVNELSQKPVESHSAAVSQLRQVVLSKGAGFAQSSALNLEPFTDAVFPTQPVIRDVWHDHVLFTGDEVTGMVDFGAMQLDNVALDLSRLLGSLVGTQPDRWPTAIEAYSKLRPLSGKEVEFIYALDQTAAFLGGLNWLKWILLENRSFESPEHVDKRLRYLIQRLSS
jgi:Ser/Thr protein kinase RdoA (MazF antagonist)